MPAPEYLLARPNVGDLASVVRHPSLSVRGFATRQDVARRQQCRRRMHEWVFPASRSAGLGARLFGAMMCS
jgi:hypothetical protein